MLFIGQTRFSLFNPKSSSWRATDGVRFPDVDSYQSYLYSDERLGLRSDIFLNLSLPQIDLARAQHDVIHVVSYSDSLPRKYQILLENAAVKYPFLLLDRHELKHKAVDVDELAMNHLRAKYSDYKGHAYAKYRLDDDDLLSVDYFDQMEPYVKTGNAGMHVSLAKGVTGLHMAGKFTNLRESYWPMHSMGHLNICAFDQNGNVIEPAPAPHNLSDRTNPVIVDARRPAYFWARHLDQDTSIDYSYEEAMGRLTQSMQRYPAIRSNADVLALFPALATRLQAESETSVISDPVPLTETILTAQLPKPLSAFKISADLQCGDRVTENNALMRFELVDSAGEAIDSTKYAAALASSGLTRSSNASIGFYRYLSTREGSHDFEFSSSLPEGITCKSIGVRRWGRADVDISLQSLRVAQL